MNEMKRRKVEWCCWPACLGGARPITNHSAIKEENYFLLYGGSERTSEGASPTAQRKKDNPTIHPFFAWPQSASQQRRRIDGREACRAALELLGAALAPSAAVRFLPLFHQLIDSIKKASSRLRCRQLTHKLILQSHLFISLLDSISISSTKKEMKRHSVWVCLSSLVFSLGSLPCGSARHNRPASRREDQTQTPFPLSPQEQQPNQSHSIKNKSFVFYWWIDGWTVPLGAMAAAKQIHLFFPLGREEKNEFCCCWWPAVQPSSSIIKQINFTLLNCFIV